MVSQLTLEATVLLVDLGWASYTNSTEDVSDFIRYVLFYLYLFLVMVPGLKITESLGLEETLEPSDVPAGLLVVTFRAYLLFGAFGAFRSWQKGRKLTFEKTSPQASEGDEQVG